MATSHRNDLVPLCETLAAQPASLGARVALALRLDALGVPAATAVWVATARIAGGRGHFHAALALIRRHLQGARQTELLTWLAQRYGAERSTGGARRPPPIPTPRPFVDPGDDDARIDAAVRLGVDTAGVLPGDEATLPEMPLFSALPTPEFVALARALGEARFAPGEALVRQGEEDRRVFVLAQGRVQVERLETSGEKVALAQVGAPALVGEMAVLTSVSRRASVVALDPVLAWRLDPETVERLGHEHPAVVSHLTRLVKQRLLANLGRTSRIFRGLPGGVLPSAVAERFVLRAVPAGGVVVEQGTPAPGLFVVLHGEADVWVTDSAAEGRTRVAVLHEGDVFGELSLLTGAPTTASVATPRGAVLLHLGPADFAAVRDDLPAVVNELVELSETRRGELEEMVGALADEGTEEVVDDTWLVPA
jgi:CRP-like cAMP-binding protein